MFLPSLLTVRGCTVTTRGNLNGPLDVIPVDFSCNEFFLGDGDPSDDNHGKRDRVNSGVDGVDQGEAHEASEGGEHAELHDGV